MRRPLALLAALLAVSLLTACGDDDATTSDAHGDEGHGAADPPAPGARRIDVGASSFEFDPDEITVDAGEDVAIALASDDIVHDFTIDELDVHVAAAGGKAVEGGLRADEPGRYTYYCSVTGHRKAGMEGTLVVR